MKKIRILALVGFVCGLTLSFSSPSHASATTQFWPVTQSFGVALSPDGETLWVSSSSPTNTLTRLHATTGAVQEVIDLSPADFPQRVAVSPDGLAVYVTAQNTTPSPSLSVVSTVTNTVTRTINLGFMPTGIAVSQDNSTIFLADYFGNRIVAVTPTGTVRGTAVVGAGPLGVAYHAAGSRLYVSNQTSNSVTTLDVSDPTAMLAIGSAIPVAATPRDLAVSPDGSEVWVPSQSSSIVSIIDTATRTVVDTVNAPSASDAVAFTPAGDSVFVLAFSFSPYGYGTLFEFNVATRDQVSATELGFSPVSLAVSHSGQTVYVTVDGGVRVVTFPTAPTSNGADVVMYESLSLAQVDGVDCRVRSVRGVRGSWVELPSMSECTVTDSSGGQLLGWATSADFPVEIARRQVVNEWGAYETFYPDGRLSGVFIPAGGFAHLTNSIPMYPIIGEL